MKLDFWVLICVQKLLEYYKLVFIKYSMYDLNCDVISYCAWCHDIGKISANDLNRKIWQRWGINIFYLNFQLNGGLGVDFIAFLGKLMQEGTAGIN